MTLPIEDSSRIRKAYHDVFIWALYASEKRLESSQTSILFDFIMEQVCTWRETLAKAGINRNHPTEAQWFSDAESLLIAFFDTAARHQLGESWNPVQKELYKHERLGQEVFDRIKVLANAPIPAEAPAEALEVFHRCLLLGYHGRAVKETMEPDLLQRFTRKLVDALNYPPPMLSPGLSKEAVRLGFMPLIGPVWIAMAAVCTSLVLAFLSYLYVSHRASEVEAASRDALKNHIACQPVPAAK